MRFRCSIRQIIPKLCAASLALLGFSCGSEEECMYGTPYGSYEIKGKVTTEDGEPIEKAVVRITNPDMPSGLMSEIADTTSSNGEYNAQCDWGWPGEKKIVCEVEDPTLEADSVIVGMKFSGSKEVWNHGHAEATVDFKLRKKSGE